LRKAAVAGRAAARAARLFVFVPELFVFVPELFVLLVALRAAIVPSSVGLSNRAHDSQPRSREGELERTGSAATSLRRCCGSIDRAERQNASFPPQIHR
jgi:hypothetical protein